MNQELLVAEEAQRIGLQFIREKYYRGKITINRTELVTKDGFPVYHLEGSIKIASRSLLGRLISSDLPYTFNMQVHALEGSILSYELR